MARFYASIEGNRGPATRMGSAASGMRGHVRGWDVGVEVIMRDEDGSDVCEVWRTGGSNGRSHRVLIARFYVDHHEVVSDVEWAPLVYGARDGCPREDRGK